MMILSQLLLLNFFSFLILVVPATAAEPVTMSADANIDVIGQIVSQKEKEEQERKKAAKQAAKKKATTSTSSSAVYGAGNSPPMGLAVPANPARHIPDLDPADVIPKVGEGNRALEKTKKLNDQCCELKNEYQRDTGSSADKALAVKAKFEAAASKDQGALQEPNSGENTFGSRSYMCGTRPGNYDVCIYEGDVSPGKFRFANKGPNKIIGAASEGRMRDWMFNFEGRNRQDISFAVSDSVDGRESHNRESHMMLFPRKYLPNIRIEGQKQIVTLPTGETVTYDATTKEITDGVLSEKPLGQGAEAVTYTGNGLFLRIDGKQDPRHARKGSMAVISKGGKTCRVPAKSLWPDQSDSSALHFKFATDSAFNEFLKATPDCPSLD